MPPRGRKRKEDSSNTTSGNNPTVSGRSAIIAPGGGTASDISKLSHNLGLPIDAVTAIMNCQGQGVRTSRRSGGGAAGGAAVGVGAIGGAVGAMSNVWGDFMNEEMPASSSSAPQPTVAVDASARSKRGENPPSESTNANAATNSTSVDAATTATTTATTNAQPSNGPRSYILPIPPRMKQPKETHDNSYDPIVPTPGLLAQTGTLDASIPGRSSISKTPSPHQLECPTLLFPNSIFQNVKFAFIATSPTACHSVAITTDGVAYGWGRNETGQLGLGYTCAVVPLPVKLTIPGEEEKDLTFVGGGVGKYHTILVASNGMAYGSGFNKCGQLGINHSAEQVDKFRKCVVMGQMRMGEEDTEGEDANVKIVQVSRILVLFFCTILQLDGAVLCYHYWQCICILHTITFDT